MNWKVLLIATVVLAWGGLYLSSTGVLIGENVTEAKKPREGERIDSETLIGALSQITSGGKVLECKYFTGLGIVRRVEPYDEAGALGASVCPRLVNLAPRR